MRHLYVTDMDGTLLGTDSRVSEESAAIISELSRRGVPVTVATARTPATVEVLLSGIFTNIPAIVMTGAALWDRNARRYIHPMLLDTGVAEMVIGAFSEFGLTQFVYVLGESGRLDVYHRGDMNRWEDNFNFVKCFWQKCKFFLNITEKR